MTDKQSTKNIETKDETNVEVPPIKIKATQNKTITEKQIQKKPKRKCTEKQLAALAAGRLKNPHYLAKLEREKLEREKQQQK